MLPLGVRFRPSDEELLKILLKFLTGEYQGIIAEMDVYGDYYPWEMFSEDNADCNNWYFFCPLRRVSKKKESGVRFVRGVGRVGANGKRTGSWHGQDKGQPVYDQYHKPFGFKRSFLYKNNKGPKQNGQWLMKEYFFPDDVIKGLERMGKLVWERKDFVLCRLKRKRNNGDEEDTGNNAAQDDLQAFIDKSLHISQCFPSMEDTALISHGEVEGILAPPNPSVGPSMEDTALISQCFGGVEVEEILAPPNPIVGTSIEDTALISDCFRNVEVEEMSALPPPFLMVGEMAMEAAAFISGHFRGAEMEERFELPPFPVAMEWNFFQGGEAERRALSSCLPPMINYPPSENNNSQSQSFPIETTHGGWDLASLESFLEEPLQNNYNNSNEEWSFELEDGTVVTL